MNDITVVICTYNRSVSLARALTSIFASSGADFSSWEILVVDNNSTDDTRDVVDGFEKHYPGRIRYRFEPLQGLANARNSGVDAVITPLLAFTDDDVLVEAGWLQQLVSAFDDPHVVAVGGPVVPLWNSPKPHWLPQSRRYSLAPLALFDPQLNGNQLCESPFGANMAFRRALFAKYGKFRSDLGRTGKDLLSNEDTEFCERLLDGGEIIAFAPSAIVQHPILDERLSKSYFLRWWFDKARADIRQHGTPNDLGPLLFGVPLVYFLRLARWSAQSFTRFGAPKRFECCLRVATVAGAIYESYFSAKRRR